MRSDPSLRQTARDAREQHLEMRRLLRQALKVMRGDSAADVRAAFDSLSASLKEHFQDEEGGMFKHIPETAPQFASQCAGLCAEHDEFRRKINGLVAMAHAEPVDEAWWQRLRAEFRAFLRQLVHHEWQENDLLQQTYMDDLGTGD
jgi:iron-sulfur cluster repair protein YtfE (RIC family)